MTGIVLSLALSVALAAPPGSPAAGDPVGEAPVSRAEDPLGVIALADTLISERREDEALAVLRAALDTPELVPAAQDRLSGLMLRSPPRRAWALGYDSLETLGDDSIALERVVARAKLRDPSPRVRAEGARALDALRVASPDDLQSRIAAGDAWLHAGRPDRALQAYGQGDGTKLAQRKAAALLAMGQYERAAKVAPDAVPAGCRIAATPVACALGLADMGFPDAAADRLDRELRNRHATLRSKAERAAGFGTLGALQTRAGRPDHAIRAWQSSLASQPSDGVRRKLVAALLADGQISTARRYVDLDDACVDVGSCPARTVKAAITAVSVDPKGDGAGVVDAITEAERLDADHPIVARQAAVYHLSHGRAQAGFSRLKPHLNALADDDEFLRLYAWGAQEIERPDLAVDAWRKGMAAARTPESFATRLVTYAELQVQAAEAAKKAGKNDDARTRYLLALTPYPTDGDRLRGLGGVLWADGKTRMAEHVYRTAWRQDEHDTAALRSLLLLLQERGAYGQASRLLDGQDLDDPKLARVAQDLRSMARAVEVEALRDAGRDAEALERLEALLAETPNDVRLLKLRADLLSGMQRYVEAAEAYRMARSVDTDGDPYIVLGEVYALLALQQVEEARALVDTVSLSGPAGADAKAAERAVLRGEAAVALAEGRDDDAMITYMLILEADPADPYTAASLSEAYASRGQLGPALAWNAQARAGLPGDAGLRARHVELLLDAGELREAQRHATRLAADDPSPTHLALAQLVAQTLAIHRAAEAASVGELERAERLLSDQLDADPDDAALLVAWARLKVRQGEPEEAWTVLHERVLADDPAHPGALATVAGIGLDEDRAADAVDTWQAAVDAGAPDWVASELGYLQLSARLAEARERHARGLQESADDIVAEAERWYGTADARRQTMLGEAWLAIDRPERAIGAFEVARRRDPAAAAPSLGLSQALLAVGDPASSEAVLADHWATYRDPEVGVALVSIQQTRGRTASARATVAELELQASSDPTPRERSSDAPLEVLALADGTTPDDALAPARAPSFQPAPVADARSQTTAESRLSVQAGVGYAGRPGAAGRNFLQAITMPIAAEADLGGVLRLQGELVPVRITDGDREEAGTGGSVAALFALGGLGAEARIGRSPNGFTVADPYTTHKLALATKLGDGVGLGLEAARAPVTDSVTSWAGARDANGVAFGGARDSWVGADLGWGGPEGQSLGIIGRVGHVDALGVTPDIPWRQGYAYGRAMVSEQENQQIWLGASGMVLDHERQVDGFRAGQAGMFSPDLFWSAIGRVEGIWGLDEGTWTACGSAGAGPQQVIGDQTLYLGPGTYVAYQLHGALKAALGEDWMLYAHGDYQGSFGEWSQTTGMLQLRYGRQDGGLAAPSSIVGSPVHGPTLTPSTQCGAEWVGWTP
jgi:tetratricopeptide (TPR) repeat protein